MPGSESSSGSNDSVMKANPDMHLGDKMNEDPCRSGSPTMKFAKEKLQYFSGPTTQVVLRYYCRYLLVKDM